MPGDRAEQRQLRACIAGTETAEQADLDGVHRVDVGIPKVDRPVQHRLPLEQTRDAGGREHACDRTLVLRGDHVEGSRILDEREIAPRDRQARLCQGHLEVVDDGAEERQPFVEAAERVVAGGGEGGAAPEPCRQEHAVLRPREDPWDRAERRQEVSVVGAARRPRRDLEERQLVHRGERAEELHEARVVPDELPIGAA